MHHLLKSAIFALTLVTFTFAATHITGDITGMTFEASGNPYIVEQDILIPSGNKAVIKEGCVFLFKPFTGLHVHGHLLVDGTKDEPVIFTSINDGEFNSASEQLPNPFDWNGILVTRESGTVAIKHFALRFSVYGIKSQNPAIRVDNGLFRQNGQFHFTINDKIQFVQDNIPYSYTPSDNKKDDKPKPPTPPKAEGDKKSPSKAVKIVRYTSLGVGIAGVGVGIVSGINSTITYIRWDTGRYDIPYSEMEKKFFNSIALTSVSSGLGIIGFTTFAITFRF
jgi:hypothetical protein